MQAGCHSSLAIAPQSTLNAYQQCSRLISHASSSSSSRPPLQAGSFVFHRQIGCESAPCKLTDRKQRKVVTLQASSGGGSSPGDDQGPKAISLARRLPSVEYTFVLAGFLKILTIGGLAYSAPVETLRTAAGQISPYLMVPVGLGMCFVAKVVVENNLQESRRFMAGLVAFLVFLYFGLYKLLYRYDPSAEPPLRTQPVSSSPVARVRAGAGDREIGGPDGEGIMLCNSGAYKKKAGRAGTFDDAAYFEGQYASDMQASPRLQQQGFDDGLSGGSSRGPVSTAELDIRNPLRRQYRAGE
ncbi:hypothetical protein DUNSADRAFT_9121 [Dunaliella salina]|uniref:Uncharacterized protein n=1 Tax=Dunaliella salina TaxID=3046 RepID=A0ABQ7GI74_DUNSA|nr:hypothetical protein DUNSADRAFT_9121 [Dunaliella salina]|eukprot:KAF5834298.1 hypothetical protein DUNSADRAFT_9121 [Dunaliella salina]